MVRISVIGAGSGVFSLGLVKDLCLNANLRDATVSFMDVDESRLEMIHKLASRYAKELGSSASFEKTTDRAASLQGADFVINTADTMGHYHARDKRDLTAKHGYYYGGIDTGSYHNFELMLSICADIERICPNAWLIQSGNPVFDGCTLMAREKPNVKVIGLCHGHYGYMGICQVLGLDPERVTWEAPGLNHCIWLTQFKYDGKDAYPLLDEWIEREGEHFWRTHVAERTHDKQMSRGSIHQYQMYGLMPIGDTPRTGATTTNWWYHTDLATKKWWFGEPFGGPDTEVARPYYVKLLEEKLKGMRDAANDPKAKLTELFGTTPTREQQVPIVDALANNVEGRFQVNYPNRGVIEGIPDDVVAEFQALIDATGVHPIKPTPLPRKIMIEQVWPFWLDMEHNLESYKSSDRSMLLWAALQSHQTRSYDQAAAVLDDVMKMHGHETMAEYFKGFDGRGDRWERATSAVSGG